MINHKALEEALCGLVCGWYPEERLVETLTRRQMACQNLAVNWGPLYETMSLRNPCNRTACLNTNSVVVIAVESGKSHQVHSFVNFGKIATSGLDRAVRGRPLQPHRRCPPQQRSVWLDPDEGGWVHL